MTVQILQPFAVVLTALIFLWQGYIITVIHLMVSIENPGSFSVTLKRIKVSHSASYFALI